MVDGWLYPIRYSTTTVLVAHFSILFEVFVLIVIFLELHYFAELFALFRFSLFRKAFRLGFLGGFLFLSTRQVGDESRSSSQLY